MIAIQKGMKEPRSLPNTGTRVGVIFSILYVLYSVFWIEEKIGKREGLLQAVTIDWSYWS
jgi:hypothetical protein